MWKEIERCKGALGRPHASLHFHRLKSRTAFCTLPLCFSCRPSCSLQLTLSHHLSRQTKYISQPAVRLRNSFRCIVTFSDWESRRKTKNLNKQIQPATWLVNRLMAAELWVALINKRLSYNQAGPTNQTVLHAQFPVQPLLFTRGEYGRLMPCFPDKIDSLRWFSSRMSEAD